MPLRAVRAFIYILNRALGPGSTALKRPLERDCKAHILFGVGSGVMLHRRFDAPLLPSENKVAETKGKAVMLRRKFLRGVLWTGNGPRLAMAILLVWTTAVEPMLAQTSPSPELAQQTPSSEAAVVGEAAPHYSMEDLSYLLEPIALYPDPLLALILSASTFPVQIVEAERWIAFNPISVRRGDFSEVDAMDWDSSVKALARFPDVIRKLANHLDWTESLGIAVAAQTSDVTTAIQLLRAKAETLGNLKSTSEQIVTTRDEGGSRVIYVLPANPERIYVPVYDPGIVFSSSAAGAIAFGVGVLVGSAWNTRWGWNNRRWNQVWINRPVWHPPPPTWRPPHRPGVRPPGRPWRPDRPGNRPERPGGRPERPGRPGGRPERPERPGGGPERPNLRPERPGGGPERPNVRPERPSRPGNRPEIPSGPPERPGTRPESPNIRPERPGGSGARPEAPSIRPERPSTGQTQGGAARPGGTQRRPGNAARPGGGHRHQTGARPHQPPRQQPGNAARRGGGHRHQTGARPHQSAQQPQQAARPPRAEAGRGARQGNQGQRDRSQGGGRSRQQQ